MTTIEIMGRKDREEKFVIKKAGFKDSELSLEHEKLDLDTRNKESTTLFIPVEYIPSIIKAVKLLTND